MERIISEYLDQFNILYCMIISSIFAAGGASAEIINGASESSSLSEMIVGPLGALALAVVILYFSVKLLIKQLLPSSQWLFLSQAYTGVTWSHLTQ